jgi:ABC-2 type transport system permease protein
MIGLAIRVIKQTLGDKRTLGMIIFVPLLMITLIYFLLGDSTYVPTIALDTSSIPSPILSAIEAQDVTIQNISFTDDQETNEYLKQNRDVDMVIHFFQGSVDLFILETNSKSAKAMQSFQKAISSLSNQTEITTHIVYGENSTTTFESISYVMVAFLSFFFVFIISGMALVREKTGGTLERFLMTPIRRFEVVGGYTLGYGVFAIVQSIVLVLYTVYILKVPCEGHIIWLLITMLLLAVVSVSFGAFVSIFSITEMQVAQFVPVVVIPQIFFSGIIAIDLIPFGLGNLAYIMPVFYGASAIKSVMIEAGGFAEIWPFLAVLLVFAILLGLINTLALKKYRVL